MHYDHVAIPDEVVPTASDPTFQHVVTTYASETNKTVSMWRAIPDGLLDFRPHEKVNTIRAILAHQILSERRFFAQFVGTEEPPIEGLLPPGESSPVAAYIERYLGPARARLPQLAAATAEWWLEERPFFGGLKRQRIWTFWRRVLHTCHHRTQVQTWLRLAGAHVPSIYGPSGDVTWDDADPTYSVEAAGRGDVLGGPLAGSPPQAERPPRAGSGEPEPAAGGAGLIIRKQIIRAPVLAPAPTLGEIDIPSVAALLVTSEDPEHPVNHAFDGNRGPGGTRWLAGEPGEQTLILAFDSPQVIRRVIVEVEEPGVARTQEIQLAASCDGGQTYRELLRQEYNFSPPGTTFEREDWAVDADAVTHLRLSIKPDKGGKPCRASLTTLALR